MNERIKELAEQADIIQWEQLPFGPITLDNESVEKAQKFAELLIQKFAYDVMDVVGASPEHIVFVAKQYGVEL